MAARPASSAAAGTGCGSASAPARGGGPWTECCTACSGAASASARGSSSRSPNRATVRRAARSSSAAGAARSPAPSTERACRLRMRVVPDEQSKGHPVTETTHVPTIELNDGRAIPQLGFGVFQIPPGDTAEATRLALEVGYRHIDTAEMYQNEQGVGEAVSGSSLDRDDIWITSKLSNQKNEPDEIRAAFEE